MEEPLGGGRRRGATECGRCARRVPHRAATEPARARAVSEKLRAAEGEGEQEQRKLASCSEELRETRVLCEYEEARV